MKSYKVKHIRDKHHSGAYNMAFDEYLFNNLTEDNTVIIRSYGWECPVLTIGYHEKIGDYNIELCRKLHIPVVRRPTGGRAVLHDNELTFAIVFNESVLESWSSHNAFTFISSIFDEFFKSLSIDTILHTAAQKGTVPLDCFNTTSQWELTDMNGNKLVGSAQLLKNRTVLHHASMPYITPKYSIGELAAHRFKSQPIENELTKNNALFTFESIESAFDRFLSDHYITENITINADIDKLKYESREWLFRK